jgi:hypothetical protein
VLCTLPWARASSNLHRLLPWIYGSPYVGVLVSNALNTYEHVLPPTSSPPTPRAAGACAEGSAARAPLFGMFAGAGSERSEASPTVSLAPGALFGLASPVVKAGRGAGNARGSGSNTVLLELIAEVVEALPGGALSADFLGAVVSRLLRAPDTERVHLARILRIAVSKPPVLVSPPSTTTRASPGVLSFAYVVCCVLCVYG